MQPNQNYHVWDIDLDSFPESNSLQKQIEFLIGFGILAPSGHNTQPWNISFIQETTLDILINKDRALQKSDPEGRQLLIGIGCFIENLVTAADYYGFAHNISYFPDSKNTISVARLTLIKTKERNNTPGHLIFSIPKRYTDRSKYKDAVPKQDFQDYISTLSNSKIRIDLVPVVSAEHARIAELAVNAQIQTMSQRFFREELSEYLKSNLTKDGVGMPGFVFNMPLPLSLITPWLIKRVNLSQKTKKQDSALLRKFTPIFLIISSLQDDKSTWIQVGRLFEHIWLTATSKNLSCAPLAAIIQETAYRDELKKILGVTHSPQIFLRVGYSSRKSLVHTPRLAPDEIISHPQPVV